MEQNNEIEKREALVILDDYSVIVAEREGLQQFFANGENLQRLADHIEKLARGLVADTSTKEGVSQIKTAARQIASVRKKVDDLGKDVVADLKALPKVIDNNRKDFRERLEALQEDIRRPVTEIEEREKAIADIKGIHFNCVVMDSKDLAEKIAEITDARDKVTKEVWKESYDAVLKAYSGEISALQLMMEAAEKREAEQRELDELRKKQEEADRIIREQKIKEEAERRAREEAEAKAAAEKARLEAEKREAEQRAAEAEKARQEAEERANDAAKANAQQMDVRMDPAPGPGGMTGVTVTVRAKPSKWTPEMKAVNNAIVEAIRAIIAEKLQGFSPAGYTLAAQEIVKAIVNGKINNIQVRY